MSVSIADIICGRPSVQLPKHLRCQYYDLTASPRSPPP